MERISIQPRADWREKVEALGFLFHTTPDQPYWNESAYYRFTEDEIDELETAANELHNLCLQAVQHVLDNNRFDELGIPRSAVDPIRKSWSEKPPSLYGRFDFAYSGDGPPKLLEYNADTPTSLLEAAVVQWHWLQELFPDADQFNSIWEGLVERWTALKSGRRLKGSAVHFGHVDTMEDLMTVATLRDTAEEAGVATIGLHMEEIGWDEQNRWFVDASDYRMWTIFKLYPWEWMLNEQFGGHVLESLDHTQWIEPIWKMVLSNKGILAILWELFPDCPYLVPAFLSGPEGMERFVKKPLLGREGEGVTIVDSGSVIASSQLEDSAEPFVWQELCQVPSFDGNRPVLGCWVIGDEARGMGIRETDGPITDDLARFVPHLFQ